MAAILVTTVKRFIGTAVERVALDTTGLQAGSTFYETDTKRFYIYSGAAWVEKPREANLDNLDIALSLVSSNITGAGAGAKTLANVVTALANIANLDITSTAVKEGIAGAGAGAKTLADIVSALTGTLTVQLTGSTVDLRGLAANKPAANNVPIGTTYWSVDTDVVEVSDGTSWVVV